MRQWIKTSIKSSCQRCGVEEEGIGGDTLCEMCAEWENEE